MPRMNPTFYIVSAFLCGFNLPTLTQMIDDGTGVHSATDIYVWSAVVFSGAWMLVGIWRGFKEAKAAKSPK